MFLEHFLFKIMYIYIFSKFEVLLKKLVNV